MFAYRAKAAVSCDETNLFCEKFMKSNIQEIKTAMRGWSIEITPTVGKRISDFRQVLPLGTTVNVASVPGTSFEDVFSVVRQLSQQDMNPVPHITARGISSTKKLSEMVERFREVNVSEILVIAGGYKEPLGEFESSIELIECGVFADYGIKRLGVAGHPEGSPDIDDAALQNALDKKNELARSGCYDIYLETQFCFDSDAIVAWEKRIRDQGNQLPIRIGLAGPAKLKTLIHFALISGVGPSLQFLKKQAKNVTKLLMVQDPSELIDSLAPHLDPSSPSRLESIHLYPFGGFEETGSYGHQLAQGHISSAKRGFAVLEDY